MKAWSLDVVFVNSDAAAVDVDDMLGLVDVEGDIDVAELAAAVEGDIELVSKVVGVSCAAVVVGDNNAARRRAYNDNVG